MQSAAEGGVTTGKGRQECGMRMQPTRDWLAGCPHCMHACLPARCAPTASPPHPALCSRQLPAGRESQEGATAAAARAGRATCAPPGWVPEVRGRKSQGAPARGRRAQHVSA